MKFLSYKNLIFFAVLFCLTACKKNTVDSTTDNTSGGGGGNNNTTPVATSFVNYTIKQGSQFSDLNFYRSINLAEQKFIVKFDSSAIYTTADPTNQADINKLYGFSDNDSAHHLFSARFGWYWLNNALWLHAYVYNNGVQSNQSLGTVEIGKEINCSIKVNTATYIFSVNGAATTMPRTSKTPVAKGYQLYPFFGGDENAPHDIKIAIKDL